jgi:hypothetical protein
MPGTPAVLASSVPIDRHVHVVRGRNVMLDSALAALYSIAAQSLNLSVKSSRTRFPEDFMFQLTRDAATSLRLQLETSNHSRGGGRSLPYVFTAR